MKLLITNGKVRRS